MSLRSILTGRRDEPNIVSVKTIDRGPVNYDPQPDKAYRVVGGGEKDIVDNCPTCAGYYRGKLETACHYCGNSRRVFLLEAGGDLPAGIINPDNIVPVCAATDINIGNEAEIVSAIGGTIIIGEEASVDYVGGNDVRIGGWFSGEYLFGQEVTLGEKCDLEGILAKNLTTGDELEIRHLLVVPPNGTAHFGNDCTIFNLVVGDGATVTFGRNCSVDNLYRSGYSNITTGKGFTCDSEDTQEMTDTMTDAQEIINCVLE